jgi:cytochrome c553
MTRFKTRDYTIIRTAFTLTTIFLSIFYANFSIATGNVEAGKIKSSNCVACHGADGNSIVPIYPKLAGQHENYLLKTLLAYQALGAQATPAAATDKPAAAPSTNNALATHKSATAQIMSAQLAQFNQQDLEDLAAYFASQKLVIGEANPSTVALGKKLYLGGDIARGIPACAACHSPIGMGNAPANFPKLSGQQSEFIKSQLNAFKNDERINDMMQMIAKKLNDNDIEAVSNFATGLH